eukprot:scaffold248799_cov79-Cyclotella_meneghiniana.AAC.1
MIPKRGGYHVAEGSGEYISSPTGDLITQRDVDSSLLSSVSNKTPTDSKFIIMAVPPTTTGRLGPIAIAKQMMAVATPKR